ncbi:hypothetical protein V3C99_008325 [Haemonchus contortus]
MSTISARKSKLMKAHTALEVIKVKISQDLISPRVSELLSPADECQLFHRRQEALTTHLSNIRAAPHAVRGKQQAFLPAISSSDNTIDLNNMQNSKLEDAIATAQSLIQILQINLEDAATRHQAPQTRLTNTQQDNDARPPQEMPEEVTRYEITDHLTQIPPLRFSLGDMPA